MSSWIQAKVMTRGISRLCHFTPSRNLLHIASDPSGILATTQLQQDEKAILNATDLARYDQHPSHICCSIQYPNSWYFRKARDNAQPLFADWVVLLIKPDHLWATGTKFCARNAAAGFGRGVAEGDVAFDAMFGTRITGAYGNIYSRQTQHPSWLTTDEQAEVLIPDRVAREDILGVAVASESQARRERARLIQLQLHVPPIFIVPEFFGDPRALSKMLRSGRTPHELPSVVPGAT